MKYNIGLFLFIAISSMYAAEYPSVREGQIAQLNRNIEFAVYEQDKIESQLKNMGIRIQQIKDGTFDLYLGKNNKNPVNVTIRDQQDIVALNQVNQHLLWNPSASKISLLLMQYFLRKLIIDSDINEIRMIHEKKEF